MDQLADFLAAGHETTASSMTWAIYMLCLNPHAGDPPARRSTQAPAAYQR